MERIHCDAGDCAHNHDGSCRASVIHVRGATTPSANGTRCGTYCYAKGPNSRGVMLYEMGSDLSPDRDHAERTAVACNAIKCTYFDDYACGAEHVHISLPNAARTCKCKTFKPK